MKTNKLLLGKSFLRTCITYFIICSLLVFVINTAVNALISMRLDNAFPSIVNMLEYDEALKTDDFASVPMRRFRGCAFMVFDEDSRMLYASDNAFKEHFHSDDLWMINEYDSDLYYTVQEMPNMPDGEYYYIALHHYNYETGETDFLNYCIVDEDYQIIEGDLFPWLEELSDREFELLQGIYQGQWEITKAVYSTTAGEERTLVFVSPRFTESAYLRALESANRLSLLSLPIILVLIVLLAILFSRKIRRAILPLHQAIVAYGAGRRVEVNIDTLPIEFRQVTDSFTHLLDRLEQVSAEKQAANEDKQRMLADLSHDLKTPLTVIQGYAQALVDGVVPPDKERQYLETICRKASDSTVLMNSLFDYVRLDHPDYVLQAETADLCEFCKSYLAEKYPEIESRGFTLSLDLPDTTVMTAFDPRLLRRLLENLTGNALQYNPAGTTLFLGLTDTSDTVRLTIADTGVGIPPELADTIFEPFVTSNRARTSGGGTGLGMAIVKKVAELHGGSIRLVRPPHDGWHTEFELTLPKQPTP